MVISAAGGIRKGAIRRHARGGALRRGVSLGLVTAVAGAALVACGGESGDTGGGAGDSSKATLTFVNAQDPGTFDKVIAGFNKENPDITIKQQVVPFDDLNTTVQSRLQSKDPGIDLYDVDEPRLASFASRGYLVDLSDLGEQASAVDPTALEATQYDGKQYAMPRWTSTQLLYYNKALLKKANVPAPSSDPGSPMTWEEVTAAGKKAQAAGAKWGLTFDQVDRYYQLQPLPESLGGGPGLKGDGLLEPDVTNDAWVKAMTWYASTFESGLSPRGIAPEQTGPLFGQGSTAFFAGGPWNAGAFDEAKVDYGVAPYPMFEGGKRASSTGSWATGVSPFSKNQDAAKKFIAYMTTNPTGAWEVESTNIPVHEDAFAKYLARMEGKGGVSTQLAEVVKGELSTSAVSRPTTAGFVDFETVMNKAFADIRNGSDPAERLQAASTELESVLKKYQQG
ncbi:MAG TPA: sugar ABC transporter substrate-binding protein [Nocardioidaceae bacterium]|nr:sugar ABC transporter substrate-binding protein [Nocardioidaceae bacterium]